MPDHRGEDRGYEDLLSSYDKRSRPEAYQKPAKKPVPAPKQQGMERAPAKKRPQGSAQRPAGRPEQGRPDQVRLTNQSKQRMQQNGRAPSQTNRQRPSQPKSTRRAPAGAGGNRRPAQGQRQEQGTRRAPAKKRSALDRNKRIILFFACVIVASTLLSIIAMSCVNDVLAMNRDDTIVTVTIEGDVTTKDVIKLLHDNKLIKNKWFCNMFAKFRKFNDNYETGVFYLKPNMGVEGMLKSLKANTTTDETVYVTFPEGFTIIEVANRLEEKGVCEASLFLETLENVSFDFPLVNEINKDDTKKYQYLEGYLFPDTYEFYIGESPSSVVKRFLTALETKITEDDRAKAQELGMTMDEVIIFASIIQKEAANAEQMPIIASILHNRLNSSEFSRLECDSTIDFLNNQVKDYLAVRKDKQTLDFYALYYNTYSDTFEGLPAGAICNPGYDAIKAVLEPDDTDDLYFCHDDTGKLYTAKTLTDHNANYAQARYVNSNL